MLSACNSNYFRVIPVYVIYCPLTLLDTYSFYNKLVNTKLILKGAKALLVVLKNCTQV